MIIVVTGSRGWTDKERIRERLLALNPELVIQGGAGGADRLTQEVCMEEKIPCGTYRAKWREYGKAAGLIRNGWMLDIGPDLVLAFWDGLSPGTKAMINETNRRGIPIEVQI